MIWVFNTANEVEYIYNSLLEGESRFCWSYVDEADLNKSKDVPWNEKSEDEKYCWKKFNFLLNIEPGDWIVHNNTPQYGQCTAAKVIAPYSFASTGKVCNYGNREVLDYRHTIGIDKNSIITFDRNDPNILPIISAKLKLRGRYWRIYYEDEFLRTLQNLKEGKVSKSGLQKNTLGMK